MSGHLLVTSALPYANGPLHLGHMVEYVQTDIYVRFLRSCGRRVTYVCADDTHGTPIELNAAKEGITPEAFVTRFYAQHQADMRDFGIGLDAFYTTNSPENRHYAELIYGRLKDAGEIDRREVRQAYCEVDKRFLPDRFVLGTCPNCGTPNQYGDVCENCGKTYTPADLIAPRCAICGTPPVLKSSVHLFFTLSRHAEWLRALLRRPGFVPPAVSNQLQAFFEKGLLDWDISRDGPYFGFPIPDEPDKYFYVWLDAPIGYVATTEKWAKDTGAFEDAMGVWDEGAPGEIVHVIGKDIVYFHALFWPAVLKVARFKRPVRLIVHGHLTVNGEKMSKSRGTLIAARDYLSRLDPAYLRYFYAANLGPGPEDFDLSLQEFRQRVNGELVNNVGNLANRVLALLAGPFEKRLAPAGGGPGRRLVEEALARVAEVRGAYERLEFRAAIRLIIEITQGANQFLQAQAPWAKAKGDREGARADLSDAAEIVHLAAALLAPVVPTLSEKLSAQLDVPLLTFEELARARYPLLDRSRPVGTPAPLLPRMEEAQVAALVASAPQATPVAPGNAAAAGAAPAPAEIAYDDFARLSLRVGRVLAAERVPKADKLLKLSVELGEAAPRTIVSGIAGAYRPEDLPGRQVVVVANLKSRKIRGIESRGMLLSAGSDDSSLRLVDPGDLPPGSEVK